MQLKTTGNMIFSNEEKKKLLSKLGYQFREIALWGEDRYERVITGRTTEVYLTNEMSSHVGELNEVFDRELKKRISILFDKVIKENSTVSELKEAIEGRRPDFSLDTPDGTIYLYAVEGGYIIEDADHGEVNFTSLSKKELQEHYLD